jgi:membrane protein YdbS with pleckstrin-like domain
MNLATQPSEIAQARDLMEHGNPAKASALLSELLLRDSRNTEARFLLGVSRFRQGEWPAAEREFRNTIALHNRNHLAHYYLGLALERQNRIDDAHLEYQVALGLRPDLAQARKKLGLEGQFAVAQPPLTGQNRKQDPAESLTTGDPETARAYAGKELLSRCRRMRSCSGLFILQQMSMAAAILFGFAAAGSPHDRDLPSLVAAAVVTCLFLTIVLVAKSITTRYTIFERRIDIESGILFRKRRSVWIYEVEDTSLSRSLLNLLTGDARLHVKLATTPRSEIVLTGLGNHQKMARLWEDLRDASLVERRAMKRWWI